MTVAELRAKLADVPQDVPVVTFCGCGCDHAAELVTEVETLRFVWAHGTDPSEGKLDGARSADAGAFLAVAVE